MESRGSFKTMGTTWWIACFECTNGINGDQSCGKGIHAKDLKTSCYHGRLLGKITT